LHHHHSTGTEAVLHILRILPEMTKREIQQRVDRMIQHLARLVLNGDMSAEDNHAALRDLAEWEKAEMLKLRARDEV